MPETESPKHARVNGRTAAVAVAVFLLTCAFVLTKTGRDALYFQERGLYDLPMAYMGIAMLSLPMALLTLWLMRSLGPRRARVIVPVAMAAVLVAFHGVARPGGGPVMTAFFMLVPLAFGVLFSLSWLLAADLLDRAPRRDLARCYSVVGAASIAGGVLGALVAKALASRIEPQRFLLLGAAGLVGSAVVMAMAQSVCPSQLRLFAGGGVRPAPADIRAVLRQRYSLLLLAVVVIASLSGVLIEFQFYLAAAMSGNSGRQNASFFANIYLVLNGMALLVQLYLMPRLQHAIGVQGSLLVLPGALLGGTAALLATTSSATRSALRVLEGGLKSSIHRANWEQAYLPLSRAQRAVAKLLVDGAGARLGEGLAATLLYLWLHGMMAGSMSDARRNAYVTTLLLGALVVWVALTRVLGRTIAAAAAAPRDDDGRAPDFPFPET